MRIWCQNICIIAEPNCLQIFVLFSLLFLEITMFVFSFTLILLNLSFARILLNNISFVSDHLGRFDLLRFGWITCGIVTCTSVRHQQIKRFTITKHCDYCKLMNIKYNCVYISNRVTFSHPVWILDVLFLNILL